MIDMSSEKKALEAEIRLLNEKLSQLNRSQTIEIASLQQRLLMLLQQSRELGDVSANERQIQVVNPIDNKPITINAKIGVNEVGDNWFERVKITPENFNEYCQVKDSSGKTADLGMLFQKHPELLQRICDAINKVEEIYDKQAAEQCGLTLKREDKGNTVRTTVMKGDEPATGKDMKAFFQESEKQNAITKNPEENNGPMPRP